MTDADADATPAGRPHPGNGARPPAGSAALPVSGIVIAMNEADRIGRCVGSLVQLCREVIVLDSGSNDGTVAVAQAHGAQVYPQPWLGFAAQKNAALARSTQPWVLLLDADEWLEAEAIEQVRALFKSGRVEHADVWRLMRRTHFLGVTLRHSGWAREPVGRLFRQSLRYKPLLVHEHLDAAGRRYMPFAARIEHDTARSTPEYAAKLGRYARLWAEQHLDSRKRANMLTAPLHAAAYWVKQCILQRGLLDGATALRFHALHARYVLDKYRLLRRLRRERASGSGRAGQ